VPIVLCKTTSVEVATISLYMLGDDQVNFIWFSQHHTACRLYLTFSTKGLATLILVLN